MTACSDAAARANPVAPQAVVRFVLPSNGQRWNWPVEGIDAIDAFVEVLDRANIPWAVHPPSARAVGG